MLGELNHRVKNTLTTVQSIARQTLRHASSPESFQERFEDRLLALSQTHNLLTNENWERGSLRALLRQELLPHGAERITLQGTQDVHLAPRAVVPLGMALHELTTNAAKYGALSTEQGLVTVRWSASGSGASEVLRINWIESDGPAVTPPTKHSFGTRLIERSMTKDLQGSAALEFDPAGLRCVLELPLNQL
jgi:two-component sensor histidine kinase